MECELRPVHGEAKDTEARVLVSHTDVCKGKVTSVEEGHDFE